MTHVSSAFLRVIRGRSSDAATVANSTNRQVVVRAARPCLIARVKRTTMSRFSISIFSDDPAAQRPRPERVNGWGPDVTGFKSPLCSVEI